MRGLFTFLVLFFFVFMIQPVQAQVTQYSDTGGRISADEEVVLSKGIPMKGEVQITGEGAPREYYVVQLARFEFMNYIPSKFPKGTFLWINPDHPKEKLLLVGFFDTYKEAQAAVLKWKKKKEFKAAFARSTPFMVKYN